MTPDRHARQARFAPIGPTGQQHIANSTVLLVGCGALGTHYAELLTRAGVRHLRIIDRDFVDLTNLQRQGLFTEAHAAAGTPKAIAAAQTLSAIDSRATIEPIVDDLTHDNAEDHATGANLIIDGTDNFETRFLLNDLSLKTNTPWIYTACVAATAVVMPILPGQTACLTCILEATPASDGGSCETAGIIMPAVLAAVAFGGAEALKLLAHQPQAVTRELRTFDLWGGQIARIHTHQPAPNCPSCARREFGYLSGRLASAAIKLCGRNSVQLRPATPMSAEQYSTTTQRLATAWPILAHNEYLIRLDAGTGLELTLFRDGRTLITGTTDPATARSLAARLLG